MDAEPRVWAVPVSRERLPGRLAQTCSGVRPTPNPIGRFELTDAHCVGASWMRLIIVANRLPFSISRRDGRVQLRPSPGGLASGLRDLVERFAGGQPNGALAGLDGFVWIGWTGEVVESHHQLAVTEAARARNAEPVYLSSADEELFYRGFANQTLWPLCHSFTSHVRYESAHWESYQRVNRIFAATVAEIARPDDLIWVHDYQLMLVPALVRSAVPQTRIGYFHHIPFPVYEIFRLLPAVWGCGLVEGLLGADLVGFHTHGYARAFLNVCWRSCGAPHRLGVLERGGHTARVGVFPMGIDAEKFSRAATAPATEIEQRKLGASDAQRKVVLSIDRLDYTKGILNRLEAFAAFLERHPEWQRRVTLALVVVPSRTGVAHYRSMKRSIDQAVGGINGRFSAVGWTPIAYRYRDLALPELAALYVRSDVALVTPLRDGMNLIAKEYIAAHPAGRGVLILSEFAGASDELGDAVIVNPFDQAQVVEALRTALEMPDAEQAQRLAALKTRVESYSVRRWADDFLSMLQRAEVTPPMSDLRQIAAHVTARYHASERRLFFLDYDGSLASFRRRPEEARPDRELLTLLGRLTLDRRNTVVLVSGRDRGTLLDWFGQLPINLIAEHGAWVKTAAGEWEHAAWSDPGWKRAVRPVLDAFSASVPGSFVEEKPSALVWHYRGAAISGAEARGRALVEFLLTFTAYARLRVIPGNKAIEVHVGGVDKGLAAERFLASGESDFVLALGDDFTDEDILAALPPGSLAVHVGPNPSAARLRIADPVAARFLLADCVAPRPDGPLIEQSLFRAEESIARVPEPGHDIRMVVEPLVDRDGEDSDLRVVSMEIPDTFGSSEEADEPDRLRLEALNAAHRGGR